MLNITKENLLNIKSQFDGKKIAVIGDMMLDCYFWGDVKRISPEAPVPVVEVDDEFYRFGGAANVAYNILKLGGIPYPIGIIGNDAHGQELKSIMENSGIDSSGIIIDKTRPTTAKTRVIADNHHIVRIDKESKKNISKESQQKIIEYFSKHISKIDGVILQDYNKGVLTPTIINEVISLSNEYQKIITVDPKFDNFFEYQNVTVFKPNKKESEDAFGIRIESEEDINNAGERLLKELTAKYVLLTLGEKGIALFGNENKLKSISTKARKVRDVSGAGDTVISTLTISLASGADINTAAYLANYAGGIVCEEVGIVPIEIDNLFETIMTEIE